jgi:2-polyprenyl-3-methyl-5-hydroxy-6-metoxy-1,4-benzoquinol methylase
MPDGYFPFADPRSNNPDTARRLEWFEAAAGATTFPGVTGMHEERYFATNSPEEFERRRLALLTRVSDPITFRRLTDLGIRQGWRCLDVGAGDGSVARWLAECVGPEGHVVATDLNTRFLDGHHLPNLEVRQHNLIEDGLEAAHYDLVHCRFVLQHLPDPAEGLRRLLNAVRPGG